MNKQSLYQKSKEQPYMPEVVMTTTPKKASMAWWEWVIAVGSVYGIIANMNQQRICFAIWFVTNAIWLLVNVRNRSYAQTVLFFIYWVLAIVGWFQWRHQPLW